MFVHKKNQTLTSLLSPDHVPDLEPGEQVQPVPHPEPGAGQLRGHPHPGGQVRSRTA